jgi:hypothetical protein
MSTADTDSNADTLYVDLELAQIADRANLLREILLACERGGAFEHRTDLQTIFAPGLAMLADDISRAAMAVYDVAGEPAASSPAGNKPSRRRPELVSTPAPRSTATLARLVLEYFGEDDEQLLDTDIKLRDVARAVLESHGAAAEKSGT